MKKTNDVLIIPKNVFLTAETLEDIEDWILSKNESFIEELRRIRNEEDLRNKGIELKEFCEKWNIKL